MQQVSLYKYWCYVHVSGCTIPFFLVAPVIIGFERARYSVSEDAGSVQACITFSGPPGVSVPVTVTAEDGTAQGTEYVCMYVCMCVCMYVYIYVCMMKVSMYVCAMIMHTLSCLLNIVRLKPSPYFKVTGYSLFITFNCACTRTTPYGVWTDAMVLSSVFFEPNIAFIIRIRRDLVTKSLIAYT